MNFCEILLKASEQDLCLEMHYMNLSGKLNRHIIYDIKVSKNYKYFKAYSFQYYEILNFKVENIKDIKVLTIDNSPLITLGTGPNEWTYIFSTNAKAPQSGIYVIACLGDNHIIFEFYYIKKSECFWSYFTGENSHYEGYFEIEPIAFHFVPIFNRNSMLWTPFEYKSKKHFGSAICIRVFTENHEQKKTRVIDTGQEEYETIQIGSYNDLSQSSCFYYDATYCHYKDEYRLWHFHYGSDNILLFKENISKKDFTILFKNCYDSHYKKKTLLSYCNMGKRYLAYHWISEFSDSGGHWSLYKKLKNNK